jgi:hypothetical protein
MKHIMGCWTLALLVVGCWQGAASALDYKLQAGIASYRWTEQFDQGTPEEAGPMLTLGAYVSGSPSVENPALTLRGEFQGFLAYVNYDTFTQSTSLPVVTTPVSTRSKYLGLNYEGSLGVRLFSPPANVEPCLSPPDQTGIDDVESAPTLTNDAPCLSSPDQTGVDDAKSAPALTNIEPFLGLGTRWWVRVIESTGSVSGYPETYNTIYGRVGVRGQYGFAGGTALRGLASIDPMLWAQERIDFSDISGERLTVKNGTRPGWTVEVGLRGPTLDGTIYWRATRFGESNGVSCFGGTAVCFQPESKQDIIGLTMGFVF